MHKISEIKHIYLVFFFLIYNSAHAQNILLNPDFEDYNTCPTNTFSPIDSCIDWHAVSNHGGDPDYYNACASPGSFGVPTNLFGMQGAHSGSGYMGMILYNTGNYKEYAYGTFSSPMVAGLRYDISFWVSLAEPSGLGASNGLGLFFSNTPITPVALGSSSPLTSVTPQFEISIPIDDKINWIQLNFEYVALGGEQVMTIGNFKSDANTNTISVAPPSTPISYIYIDDFIVKPSCSSDWTPITLCISDPLIDLNTLVTGAEGGSWNGFGVTGNMFNPSVGTQSITYTAPCSETSTQMIVVKESLEPVWTASDTTIYVKQLLLNAQNPGANFKWQNGSISQTYTATSSGLYFVHINNGGCKISDTIKVTMLDTSTTFLVEDEELLFYIPNAFTPNKDEYNNTFLPVFESGYDPYYYHLIVFNRWGEIVFESYDPTKGWDGKYGDKNAIINGVFLWKIEFRDINNSKNHIHYGHVTLIK